jgi:hypothetical protein
MRRDCLTRIGVVLKGKHGGKREERGERSEARVVVMDARLGVVRQESRA